MVKGLETARKVAGRALESTYEGVCKIVEYRDVKDEKSEISYQKEQVVLENQPCKLSFEKLNTAVQTETGAAGSQSVKLFLSPEIKIDGNSKIIVDQCGMRGIYSASGEPAVYATHQEIPLILFKGWC